jgi:hypothetical protein
MFIKIDKKFKDAVAHTCLLHGVFANFFTCESNNFLCVVEINEEEFKGRESQLVYLGMAIKERMIDEMTDLEFEKSILMNLENREETLKFREDFLNNFKGITFSKD